jgi:hypothetical protein
MAWRAILSNPESYSTTMRKSRIFGRRRFGHPNCACLLLH